MVTLDKERQTINKKPISKAEAETMLEKDTKNLTPAQKEFLQNVVTNLPPETTETPDQEKERNSKRPRL